MSAASATVPSAPVVSITTMGGAGGAGGGAGVRAPPVSGPGSGPPGSKCCENGRPVTTDPLTGQTICSCQYNPGALLMAAGCYPRGTLGVGVGVPGLAEAAGVYTSPYAIQSLLPAAPGAEHAAFYSSMSALQGAPGYYAYDPFGAYPYGNGFAMDPNARRKNATRESTQTLKAWLSEHRKNPYPTKGEKIMLAIITKMTLTQVSTWFANARRRLKKENKMTWSPRNRCGEDDEDVSDEDDDVTDKMANVGEERDNDANNNRDYVDDTSENNDVDVLDCDDMVDVSKSKGDGEVKVVDDSDDSGAPSGHDTNHEQINSDIGSAFTLVSPSRRSPSVSPHLRHHTSLTSHNTDSTPSTSTKMTPPVAVTSPPVTSQKPKIWSVADVMAKSSRDKDSERTRSPAAQNGSQVTHPAFPTGAATNGSIARSIGLWNAGVTSLPVSRYHPYGIGQGLFSVPPPGGATSRAHFGSPAPPHGLPSSMVVHNLMGAAGGGGAAPAPPTHPHPHPHPTGLSMPPRAVHVSPALPTDLRKISAPRGHTSAGSPDDKSDVTKSRDSSPILPTAFKPVARSS